MKYTTELFINSFLTDCLILMFWYNVQFQQADFDQLLVNLRMDAVYVKENMRIRWVSETGILESIPKIVKEYKESRGLMVSSIRNITVCVPFDHYPAKNCSLQLYLKE